MRIRLRGFTTFQVLSQIISVFCSNVLFWVLHMCFAQLLAVFYNVVFIIFVLGNLDWAEKQNIDVVRK